MYNTHPDETLHKKERIFIGIDFYSQKVKKTLR